MLVSIFMNDYSRIKFSRFITCSCFISCLAWSCSLSLDLNSNTLINDEQSTDELYDMGEDLFAEQISDLGLNSRNDMYSSDQDHSTTWLKYLDRLSRPSVSQREVGIDHSQINSFQYAGEFGSQAGMMIEDMGASTDIVAINSPLQPHLPEVNCVMYDVINEQCVKYLNRDRDEMCDDWQANYQMLRPLPWSGDRLTCQVGTYHQQGYDDFDRLLNLYRRQLSLPEVVVSSNDMLSECALAYDVVDRDGLETFTEETSCFSPIRQQAANLDNRITIVGNWSLYTSLQSILGPSQAYRSLPSVLQLRSQLISPATGRLLIGGRGRAACLQTETGILPNPYPKLISVPSPGENPYAMIKDGNHNGRVPWTVHMTENGLSEVNLTVHKKVAEEFELQTSSIELIPINTGGTIVSLVLEDKPQAGVVYRIDLTWISVNGMNHYQIYTMFELCGLTLPDECTPTPDNCTLNGSHCTLLNVEEDHWGCQWNGPAEIREACDHIGNSGCSAGVCISFDSNPSICAQICDRSVPDMSVFSCSTLCSEQVIEQGSYGLCP